MYCHVGSQAIGALSLADRIEDWDPEHQAKLRHHANNSALADLGMPKEPLCKLEGVKGVAPRADKIVEIWELENWRCFRRRGVKRYVFASEGWTGKTPKLSLHR